MRILKSLRRRFQKVTSGSKSKREHPSINDYNLDDVGGDGQRKLIAAMGGGRGKASRHGSATSGSDHSTAASGDMGDDPSVSSFGSSGDSAVEWTLPLVDEEVTVPQTMEEEMQRLKTLNNYFVLDSDGEIEFDRITTLASQIFDAPIALISLIDLGRQWFLSKVGLDATETPRKHAFCAHVILNKYKLLVVPDATQDFRFKDNPLVKDGLKIRFYAGAALVSPEGYKLGTLCIISPQVRPEGLSQSQQAMLHEMAAMVVSAMVARRNRILKDEYETRFLDLAKTLKDTNYHLEQSRTILSSLLTKEHDWAMDSDVAIDLASVARSLGVQSNICAATMRTVLQDSSAAAMLRKQQEPDGGTNGTDGGRNGEHDAIDDGHDDLLHEYDRIITPTTDMVKLFDSINQIIPTFPFHGSVHVELDKSVPKEIVAEDLLLFRSTLNMLTHCMGSSGPDVPTELNHSGLRIRRMKRNGNELLFQCLKAGPPVDPIVAKELYAHSESLLGPVASMVRSLGGRYGMFEGKWDHQNASSSSKVSQIQSIFWFQIPYDIPPFALSAKASAGANSLSKTLRQSHVATTESMEKSKNQTDKVRFDPFQSALMDAGCGGHGR